MRNIFPHPLNGLPTFTCGTGRLAIPSEALRKISEIAKSPIIAAMKSIPPRSSMLPKENRGTAAGLSSPTVETSSPTSRLRRPFTGRPAPMKAAQVRPSVAIQKYSGAENFSAISASDGAAKISTAVPTSPPKAENSRFAAIAVSASPFSVIW